MARVKLIGEVSIAAQLYSTTTGEISFTSTVMYEEVPYKRLPFLRLTIERCDEEKPVEVSDEYISFFPYFKQLPGFRKYFPSLVEAAMQTPLISSCNLFEEGLRIYAQRLSTYTDVQSLVSQAKRAVQSLDVRSSSSGRKARKVLEVLGVTPVTDIEFLT